MSLSQSQSLIPVGVLEGIVEHLRYHTPVPPHRILVVLGGRGEERVERGEEGREEKGERGQGGE